MKDKLFLARYSRKYFYTLEFFRFNLKEKRNKTFIVYVSIYFISLYFYINFLQKPIDTPWFEDPISSHFIINFNINKQKRVLNIYIYTSTFPIFYNFDKGLKIFFQLWTESYRSPLLYSLVPPFFFLPRVQLISLRSNIRILILLQHL